MTDSIEALHGCGSCATPWITPRNEFAPQMKKLPQNLKKRLKREKRDYKF